MFFEFLSLKVMKQNKVFNCTNISYGHSRNENANGIGQWCQTEAISQVTSSANIKIFSGQGPDGYMQNVIYREVLEM
jgi:hypothetical protein